MFWIIAIAIFIIYLFVSTKREETQKVKQAGGFYIKYKTLIDFFLQTPNIEIEKRSNNSIILAVKEPTVVTRFTITHGFEDVTIFWIHESYVLGKHSLHWTFPESLPQTQMIHTICQEMEIYERNLLGDGFN